MSPQALMLDCRCNAIVGFIVAVRRTSSTLCPYSLLRQILQGRTPGRTSLTPLYYSVCTSCCETTPTKREDAPPRFVQQQQQQQWRRKCRTDPTCMPYMHMPSPILKIPLTKQRRPHRRYHITSPYPQHPVHLHRNRNRAGQWKHVF